MRKEHRQIFDDYYNYTLESHRAVTVGQRLEMVKRLSESARNGIVPISANRVVRLETRDQRVSAVLAGERVSIGGESLSVSRDWREILTELSFPLRIGLLVLMGLIPILAAFLALKPANPDPQAADNPSIEDQAAGVGIIPLDAAPVADPFLPQPREAQPAQYSLTLNRQAPGEESNDPVSLQIANLTYILGEGQVSASVWEPSGAEWLAGTTLRRVVAIPYEPASVAALRELNIGDEVFLRLASGVLLEHHILSIKQVKRHQIELLSTPEPSLVVFLHGERSGDRWLVIAEPLQWENQIELENPLLEPSVPIPIPQPAQVMTTDRVISQGGLTLTVVECGRVEKIGEQPPPRGNQQYLVCSITLTASARSEYSGAALALSEFEWITGAVDWWPPAVPIQDQLGDGVLEPGESVRGIVAGIIIRGTLMRRSEPILVWEHAGTTFLVSDLETPTEPVLE